ncbi:MAG: HAD family hydrolase [Clostridia bacterium]|nr:HAD family hydrolase [Clostridia bacterium]
MSITTILFDLDGTLLPMDQDVFVKAYFNGLAQKLAPRGYEPKQLIDAIWAGTAAMVKNTGGETNEKVFWRVFSGIFGEKAINDEPYFDEFYRTDFQKVQSVCGFEPQAATVVRSIKQAGYRVALATNPIFPAIATESRMRWAGLSPDDFELYTTYENIGYCKPNLDYYKEIINRLGVKAQECLMVGNDVGEDMVARETGMNVFLLTDYLINKKAADISAYPHGGFAQLSEFIS